MTLADKTIETPRYARVPKKKSGGVTYTPKTLADFVADRVLACFPEVPEDRAVRVLDPAVGGGELLVSLLEQIPKHLRHNIQVHGFETDTAAMESAAMRLMRSFPDVAVDFRAESFLEIVSSHFSSDGSQSLFSLSAPKPYDLIIANPPYVRTQIMGSARSRLLASQFGLSGRVDLYYAFILGIAQMLKPKGIAGIIVSNRFMTTKSGAPIRKALFDRFNIRHIWDLGDTKLFDAAVLPAVLLLEGKQGEKPEVPAFTSIYQTSQPANASAVDPIAALRSEGVVATDDGRRFHIQHGQLYTSGPPDGVWRIATRTTDTWLATVEMHRWGTFRDIGKIRVGIKTCADKIFIRNDWQDMPESVRPELLRPLTTHRVARRFKPLTSELPTQILYPHETVQGRRRAVPLSMYPQSQAYLRAHRTSLEARKYLTDGGRKWYEIWVPQDPRAWNQVKLVFRDIAEHPTFWVDLDKTIVNGDCYWLTCRDPSQTDLLWLAAAVGNSTFIERFYDQRFNNRLYAGRRRFMAQYVEKFPLPNPDSSLGEAIIAKAKEIYQHTPSSQAERMEVELDAMVWKAFGLVPEESRR